MKKNQKPPESDSSNCQVHAQVSSCDICREPRSADLLKHLPIYVFGSEGIKVCDICQQAITDYIRSMRCVGGRAYKQGYIKSKSNSNC